MQVIEKGSVRIDLLGGTLDLPPIDNILNSKTLNFATSLFAEVKIEANDNTNEVVIFSEDYNKSYSYSVELLNQLKNTRDFQSQNLEEMEFVIRIITLFPISSLKISLKSGSPPGGGLGGSSAMGVTLFKVF